MAKLELEIIGYNKALDGMTINGKHAKVKKDGDKRVCQVETDKDTAEINIYRGHYYTGKNWFWWALLYYIVSVFGLFDIKLDKRCQVNDCRLKIKLNGDTTKATLQFCNFKDGGKFMLVKSDAEVEEDVNVQYFDKEAQKKHKKMKKAKIWMTIGVIVIAVVLCVVLI